MKERMKIERGREPRMKIEREIKPRTKKRERERNVFISNVLTFDLSFSSGLMWM